jgi:Sulfotransferase family
MAAKNNRNFDLSSAGSRAVILSHKHRFALLSPWKTASSTCHERLSSYNESIYSRFFQFNKHLNRVVHQHVTFSEFLSLPEAQLGYTVGAFIRNPYDRAYSGFIQIQRDIILQPRAKFPEQWVKDLVMTQLTENARRLIQSGYDFNKWILSIPEYEIFEVGRNTNFPLHPSHYWTHSSEARVVDYVGKVENFEDDFAEFCLKVGIPVQPILNANITTRIYSRCSTPLGYKYISRMSTAAIARINDLFKKDFELFGYDMITAE